MYLYTCSIYVYKKFKGGDSLSCSCLIPTLDGTGDMLSLAPIHTQVCVHQYKTKATDLLNTLFSPKCNLFILPGTLMIATIYQAPFPTKHFIPFNPYHNPKKEEL